MLCTRPWQWLIGGGGDGAGADGTRGEDDWSVYFEMGLFQEERGCMTQCNAFHV